MPSFFVWEFSVDRRLFLKARLRFTALFRLFGLLAVLDGSQAVGFFEHSDEVTVIRKPDFLDDAFDGHVGAGQISAGAVKAHNVKVLGNGFAGVLFENAADV